MSQPQQYPPTPPGPPPRRGVNLGWLIGGVSGSLAILLAVTATLVGTGVFGSASHKPGSGDRPTTEQAAEKYQYVEDMCTEIDVSALEELAPLDGEIEAESDEDGGKQSEAVCRAGFLNSERTVAGRLYASASRFTTEAAAAKDATTTRNPDGLDGEQVISDLTGNWDFGNIATQFYPSTGSLRMYVLIQDDDFTAIAEGTFTQSEGVVDETELRGAVIDTAIGILELHRK